jgi:hypothetical protein
MKFPKRDAVEFVIKSILSKQTVGSQTELQRLVNRRLRAVDREYAITGERLRRIAAGMPGVVMQVKVRDGPPPEHCPCCGAGLRRTWTRNLKGTKVPVKVECRGCSYRGREGKWTPGQYRFWLRKRTKP